MTPLSGEAAALAARMSVRVLQVPLDLAVRRTLERHPGFLRRICWREERTVLVIPDDLPLVFLVRLSARQARIEVLPAGAPVIAEASIRGAAASLFDIFLGGEDGDAQFFSRALSIEGDTELVVALRNTLDAAEIDPVADFMPCPPPLAPLLRRGLARVAGAARAASDDLDRLHRLLLQIVAREEGESP